MYFLFEVRFRKFYLLLESLLDKVCVRNDGRLKILESVIDGYCVRYDGRLNFLESEMMDIVSDMMEDEACICS